MKKNALTTIRLSGHNLRYNLFRSLGLMVVVSILSFALFGGSILSQSLKNGMNSLKERLGADLAIVPLDHEADYEGILLSGEPGRFYFNKDIARQIAEVEGVAQVSTQFYISTLAAACCSVPVQVIGFNPDTDFSVQPWIAKVYDGKLKDGELIAGSDIDVDESGTLKFFNNTYSVVAQLDKTSTGMDYSVYADMDTIRTLIAGARETGMNLNVDVYDTDIENAISTVLVKLKKDYDADTVATNIRRQISGISIAKSKSIFSSIADNLDILLAFIRFITAVLWALAVLVLTILFSVIVHGRKKELALFRSLGATRKKLVRIILTESFLISALGGIAGAAVAALVVFPFSTYLGEVLKLPYLLPDARTVLRLLGLSLFFSVAVGPLGATYSAVKIGKAQTYTTMREGE